MRYYIKYNDVIGGSVQDELRREIAKECREKANNKSYIDILNVNINMQKQLLNNERNSQNPDKDKITDFETIIKNMENDLNQYIQKFDQADSRCQSGIQQLNELLGKPIKKRKARVTSEQSIPQPAAVLPPPIVGGSGIPKNFGKAPKGLLMQEYNRVMTNNLI